MKSRISSKEKARRMFKRTAEKAINSELIRKTLNRCYRLLRSETKLRQVFFEVLDLEIYNIYASWWATKGVQIKLRRQKTSKGRDLLSVRERK